MICSPLLAKQYFLHQRRPAFTDLEMCGRLCILRWSTIMATTRPITLFYQAVKVQQSFLNQSLDPRDKEFLDPPRPTRNNPFSVITD